MKTARARKERWLPYSHDTEKVQTVFDDSIGIEQGQLYEMRECVLYSLTRQEPDQLTIGNFHTASGREQLNQIEDGMHGCLFKVGQIHGDLYETARGEAETERFDTGQAAAAGSYGAGDLLCDANVCCGQVDVESDEDFAGADDDGAGSGVKGRAAEIGRTGSASGIFQLAAFGTAGRRFIKIDGNTQFVPNASSGTMRQFSAIGKRDAAEGNERQDVQSAEARVNPFMTGEIN